MSLEIFGELASSLEVLFNNGCPFDHYSGTLNSNWNSSLVLVYLLSTNEDASDWSFILQNKQNVDIGFNPYNDLVRIVEEDNMWLHNYASASISLYIMPQDLLKLVQASLFLALDSCGVFNILMFLQYNFFDRISNQ